MDRGAQVEYGPPFGMDGGVWHRTVVARGAVVFEGDPIGFMMARWAQQLGILPLDFNDDNSHHQLHFQDPVLTPTLLLNWAHAWAGYVGANNAQAVYATHVAPILGFFPLRLGRNGGAGDGFPFGVCHGWEAGGFGAGGRTIGCGHTSGG